MIITVYSENPEAYVYSYKIFLISIILYYLSSSIQMLSMYIGVKAIKMYFIFKSNLD